MLLLFCYYFVIIILYNFFPINDGDHVRSYHLEVEKKEEKKDDDEGEGGGDDGDDGDEPSDDSEDGEAGDAEWMIVVRFTSTITMEVVDYRLSVPGNCWAGQAIIIFQNVAALPLRPRHHRLSDDDRLLAWDEVLENGGIYDLVMPMGLMGGGISL